MLRKIATLVSHTNLNVQFLRLNKTYPQPDLLPSPDPGASPSDPPYGTLTNLTLTQGASPPDPPYGILTYLTLTPGASPPDPPYGTLTYLTLTITLFYKA